MKNVQIIKGDFKSSDFSNTLQKEGPFGESWLTLEQRYEYDYDDIDIATNTPIANKCSDTTLGNINDNQAQIFVDTWTEIRNQELLRADLGYEFRGGDLGSINGKTVTYGELGKRCDIKAASAS